MSQTDLKITVKPDTPETGYFTASVTGPLAPLNRLGTSTGTARSEDKAIAFALENYSKALKVLKQMGENKDV